MHLPTPPNPPRPLTLLPTIDPSPARGVFPVDALLPGRSETSPGHRNPVESLYIHVPFCFHKCHYCDFYSFVDQHDQQAPFVDRLIEELTAIAPLASRPLRTIFVGGGTPSLLQVHLWKRLLTALDGLFDLSLIRAAQGVALSPPGEFTVECNPETVTPELLETLVGGGLTRVSVGAQSFHEQHLKTLERWHDPANVAKALDLAARAGVSRRSLDLIYAIPGQTLEQWEADLGTALDIGTTHLSCYNLTYEANTAMTIRLNRGEFTPIHEDTETDMFEATSRILESRGLQRYEVSNYAVPGHECLHNLAYWRQSQWLAAGPSASGHIAGWRWKNLPHLPAYLASSGVSGGLAPATDLEPPDRARAVRERIMTGIRLREGLDRDSIIRDAEAAVPGSVAAITAKVHEFIRDGLLTESSPAGATPAHPATRWAVTPRGWLLADFLARKLMAPCLPT